MTSNQGDSPMNTIKPGTNTSFGSLKQINAGVLNVGYAEAGPTDGSAVILLHGWPYDIHSYVDVAPLLALAGYRVIVPYLRGYGTTTFLSSTTPRNGQQAVIAVGSDWLKVSRTMTSWNSGSPKLRPSPCLRLRWKAMPMGPHIPRPVPMPGIRGSLCAPGHHGRRRAQSAPRSASGLCPGGH